MTGRPVANRFKVQKKVWGRWHPEARHLFNDMMNSLRPQMQGTLAPNGAQLMPRKQWNILRWNLSWTAASLLHARLKKMSTASKQSSRSRK